MEDAVTPVTEVTPLEVKHCTECGVYLGRVNRVTCSAKCRTARSRRIVQENRAGAPKTQRSAPDPEDLSQTEQGHATVEAQPVPKSDRRTR